jgi:hypothetical protein
VGATPWQATQRRERAILADVSTDRLPAERNDDAVWYKGVRRPQPVKTTLIVDAGSLDGANLGDRVHDLKFPSHRDRDVGVPCSTKLHGSERSDRAGESADRRALPAAIG